MTHFGHWSRKNGPAWSLILQDTVDRDPPFPDPMTCDSWSSWGCHPCSHQFWLHIPHYDLELIRAGCDNLTKTLISSSKLGLSPKYPLNILKQYKVSFEEKFLSWLGEAVSDDLLESLSKCRKYLLEWLIAGSIVALHVKTHSNYI